MNTKNKLLKNIVSLISKSLSCTIAFSMINSVLISTTAFSSDISSNSNTYLVEREMIDIPDIIGKDEAEKNHYVGRVKSEEKDLYTFIFKNADGTNTLRMFSHPVKYIDNSGETKDISLEINKNKDGSYGTTDHIVKAEFGSDISKGINLNYDDINIGMIAEIDNANQVVPVLSDDFKSLSYNIDDKTSFVYSLTYQAIILHLLQRIMH